jgi:hypothetical protein
MPKKNNLPFILAGILAVIVIYFVFLRNGNKSKEYPFNINGDVSGFSGFRSISNFGAIDINNTAASPPPTGVNTIKQYTDSKSKDTLLYPGQSEWNSTYYIYKLLFYKYFQPLIISNTVTYGKLMDLIGFESDRKTFKGLVPIKDQKQIIDNFTPEEKKALIPYFVTFLLGLQGELFRFIEACEKSGSTCNDTQKGILPLAKNYLNATSYILNFDLVNGIEKTGSGWNQYFTNNLNVNGVDKSENLPIPLKPVKVIGLKFFGSEKSKTTPGTVTVKVTGEDSKGTKLDKSFSTNLAYSLDPTVLYPNIFFLPLDYPVTVKTISLTVSSTDGSFQDGQILFVYQ